MVSVSTTGMKCFHTCLSVCLHLWGYPHPADRGDAHLVNQEGVLTRGVPPSFMTGGYSIWLTGRGVPPILGLDEVLRTGWGYPPCWDWMGYSPPIRTGWGYPPIRTGFGYPPPIRTGFGYLPVRSQSSRTAGSHVTMQLSATHSLGWEPCKDPTSCEANSRKHQW